MKIAIISPFQLRLGRGIERFHWSLACAWASRGVEVDILTWMHSNAFDWGTPPLGVRFRRVPNVRYHMARWAALWYQRWLTQGYDHVLLAFASYGEGLTLRRLGGRSPRFSIVFHFPLEQTPHRYSEFQQFGLPERAQHLIAPSEYVADGVKMAFGKAAVVIPNGVDPVLFSSRPEERARIRRELGVSDHAPVLITAAALEDRKGIQFVLRALPALLAQHPDLEYWVLGEGSYRPTLEAEIARLGIAKHVRMLGVQRDVQGYMNAADVGCLLSWGEAFGMTLVECMAVGLPVLTSTRPPFSEIIEPGYGVIVDEQDSSAVSGALWALLRDRRAMGEAARQAVMARFTWERISDVYLDLLGS